MKKVFMLIAMALLVNVTFAQTSFKANENLLASITTETPLIIDGVEWKAITQYLGKIQKDQPIDVKFELTNRNDSPLLLKEVKASCGCTGTDFTQEPILPGASTVITATYNAKTEGVFNKTVKVITNMSKEPLVLKFNGEVAAKKAK